jgi:3-hydroxyacyl-CoA dehydrogenase/enoyl-CoA hydratase/3-hydroxybutyryl-CoA epimerase
MNSTIGTQRHLVFTRKDTGVAIMLLDCPGKLNTLTTTVMKELREAVHLIRTDPSIKAAVFISGKPDTFVMGADLFEIRKLNSDQLRQLACGGQATLNEGVACSKPIVVAINGICLGGGLELSMACHWRIATDMPNTQLGLPETRLGLIPGLGGTQRLPRLVGLKQAMGMILSAEPISAREALNCGLVDELVSPDQLMSAAEQRALDLAEHPEKIAGRRELLGTGPDSTKSWPVKDLDQEKAAKFFAMTERSLRIRTKGNYPAQTKVVEIIKSGLLNGVDSGLKLEADTFVELAGTEVFSNLLALFFQTDFAKQSAASLATKFNQNDTSRLGIIGGGMMGGSIAKLGTVNGLSSTVKVRSGSALLQEAQSESQAIAYSDDYAKLADCQILIECIGEDVAAKKDVLRSAESAVSENCVIASNTSALSLSELASALTKPERFVGVHFFHPVDRMPLVEIVSLKTTGRQALARAADLVAKLGKIPVMVKDGPGFLINRLLSCYLMTCARLLQEKVPLNWIEDSALGFGMPMGPFELLDEVGLDLAYTIAVTLNAALGDRMKPPSIFESIPKLGLKGKKTGAGVYAYDESGKRISVNPKLETEAGVVVSSECADDSTKQELVHRLIFPMIDEAARCLEDRIVMKPREIDMAIVYGIGFPPFRGGLLKYADHVGIDIVARQIEEIHKTKQDPRQVSPLMKKYLSEGRGFYSRGGKEDE